MLDSIETESLIVKEIKPSNNYDMHKIYDTPELQIGLKVIINNKNHPLNLTKGEIIDRSYGHYRIKFDDTNCIWIPDQWVDPLPKG